MKVLCGSCAILVLVLAGCGSANSLSPSHPSQQKVERVVAARVSLDPKRERVAGALLTVEIFLRRAEASLSSGFNLQGIQLPESAAASFGDALGDTRGAAYVLERDSSSGVFPQISSLLRQSLADFTASAAEGMRSPSASQSDARNGRQLLASATALLAARPESGTRLAQIASQDALHVPRAIINPFRPRARPAARVSAQPRVTVVSSPRLLVGDLKPKAPPVVAKRSSTFARASRRLTARRPATRRSGVARRRFASPAAKPKLKTDGLRTVAVTHRRAIRASTTFVTVTAAQTRNVSHAAALIGTSITARLIRARVELMLTRLKQCGDYVTSLATGSDPLGSTQILTCIARATARVRALLARTSTTHQSSMRRRELTRAIADLDRARLDIRVADIQDAATQLRHARSRVSAAVYELLTTSNSP